MKIVIQKKEKVDDKIKLTVSVMDGTKEVFGRNIEGRTEHEITHQLKMLDQTIRERDAEFVKVPNVGEWIPPAPEVVVEPTPEPTPEPTDAEIAEQKKQMEIQQTEMEIATLVEKAKKDKEAKELAVGNTDLAAKLAELETLKTTI